MQSVAQDDRSTRIGSSDIAAILGLSPWRTPLDVWMDKTKGQQPVTPEKKKIFARGHRLEPYIVDMYSEEQEEEIIRRNHRYSDLEFDFIGAEIDAETKSGKNVEAKSTHQFGGKLWGVQMTDEVPVYYNAQAQFGMMVNHASLAEMPVLVGIDDFRVYQIMRDDVTVPLLRDTAVNFWHNHILTGISPEPTTVGDLERLFPWDHGSVIQATDEIRDKVLELKRLKSKIKTMVADQEEIEELIKLFMREHSVLNYGAATLLTWKSQKSMRHDTKLFESKHPAIAERFKKESISRVMRIK